GIGPSVFRPDDQPRLHQEDRERGPLRDRRTLDVQATSVRIASELWVNGDNAPSDRIVVDRAKIGAALSKRLIDGRSLSAPEAGKSELRASDLRQPLR